MKYLLFLLIFLALPAHAAPLHPSKSNIYEDKINYVRKVHGVYPLQVATCLRQQAMIRAKYIMETGNASHKWDDGMMFSQHNGYCERNYRMETLIYWTPEQLQQVKDLPQWIAHLWYNSPEHKAVMMATSQKYFAIVVYQGVVVMETSD